MFILRPDALSLNGSIMINQSINQASIINDFQELRSWLNTWLSSCQPDLAIANMPSYLALKGIPVMVQSPAFRGTRLQKIFSGGRRWWYGGGAFKLHAWGSNRMSVQPSSLPRGLRRDLLNRTVHLAIIQACFTSNLRRSNWKSTVQRFFKSTVMIVFVVQGARVYTPQGVSSWSMKQGLDANWCSAPWYWYVCSKFPWFLGQPGQMSVCCPSVPTSSPNTSSLHWSWGITLPWGVLLQINVHAEKYPQTTHGWCVVVFAHCDLCQHGPFVRSVVGTVGMQSTEENVYVVTIHINHSMLKMLSLSYDNDMSSLRYDFRNVVTKWWHSNCCHYVTRYFFLVSILPSPMWGVTTF
jgi:hypothetical protein